jgi:hypothetical protein
MVFPSPSSFFEATGSNLFDAILHFFFPIRLRIPTQSAKGIGNPYSPKKTVFTRQKCLDSKKIKKFIDLRRRAY